MIKEAILPAFAAIAARYAPRAAATLLKHQKTLRGAAKLTGTGIFKGRYLNLPGKVTKSLIQPPANLAKWYTPKGLGQQMVREPVGVVDMFRRGGIKKGIGEIGMKRRFHVDPKTGRVKVRSHISRLAQPLIGGGVIGGLGFGALDLASGRKPHQAAGTAIGWGVAPTAMMTGIVGKMGYDILKKKNKD